MRSSVDNQPRGPRLQRRVAIGRWFAVVASVATVGVAVFVAPATAPSGASSVGGALAPATEVVALSPPTRVEEAAAAAASATSTPRLAVPDAAAPDGSVSALDEAGVESSLDRQVPQRSGEAGGPLEQVLVRPDQIALAAPTGPPVGRVVAGTDGPLLRVSVEVEDGLAVDLEAARREVERILADPRGWTAPGTVRFQVVDHPASADARIRIASPETVDARCWPLQTVGRLSCRNGDALNINAERWLGATDFWDAPLAEYRAYVINHEMGHLLARSHEWCPAPGEPAPVMQQQTKGLAGCSGNGWPYPDG